MPAQVSRTPARLAATVVAVLAVLAVSVWLVHTHDSGGSAAADSPNGGTITVGGRGVVQGVPDTLTATLVVHQKGISVQGALNGSSASARAVIGALRANGVPRGAIQTSDLTLDQSYDNHGNVDGYESDETLTVQIHPLSGVGKILAAAATAAGDHVRVDGLSLNVTDDTQLLNTARAKAFTNAKDAASQDASLAGRQLGQVISVKETRTTSTPVTPFDGLDYRAAALSGASVPIRAGKQPVTVNLDVVWSQQ
jgi:uncharacterized protein YggE